MRVIAGTEDPKSADVVLTIDGVDHSATAQGDGPVDAVYKAIDSLVDQAAS